MAEKDSKEVMAPLADKPGAEETAAKIPPNPPAKDAQAGKPTPPATDQVVDQWVVEYFYNSPIARNTACWNLLMQAKEVLKERLKGE